VAENRAAGLPDTRRYRCEICEAPKGEPCRDTTVRKGQPPRLLPRGEHLARVLPPGRSKLKPERNEMLA
jgi:hypothetical protein